MHGSLVYVSFHGFVSLSDTKSSSSIVIDIFNESKMSMSDCQSGFIYFRPYVKN